MGNIEVNHYPHHIGDFDTATRHLTRVERSLYRDLMDLYYAHEKPLPGNDLDYLQRRVLAISEEEKTALKAVLSEFFTLEDGLYHNARCDEEIARYQRLIKSASNAGKASAEKRLNGRSTVVQRSLPSRSTNQNQNQNHILRTSKEVRSARPGIENLVEMGVQNQAGQDWLAVRRAKSKPLTWTALDGLSREAKKAGIDVADAVMICATRGWLNFNAGWDWRDSMPKKTAAQLLDEAEAQRKAA